MKINQEDLQHVDQIMTVLQIFFVMKALVLVLAQIFFAAPMLSVSPKIMRVINYKN